MPMTPPARPAVRPRTSLSRDRVLLGCLRRAGFPVALAGHAYSVLDSHLYGFALQEASLPFETGPETAGSTSSSMVSSGP
jgi:hypothetical protein